MKNEAGKVFATMVEAVPERELSAEAVRAIVREAEQVKQAREAREMRPAGKNGRSVTYRERSSLPLAVAALALFVLVPALSSGWSGPTLAERAEEAYESGLFARYGSVILEAMKQGSDAETRGL